MQGNVLLLSLGRADIDSILNKWLQKGWTNESVARNVRELPQHKRLYGRQLFAFLSLLFEQNATRGSHEYLRKFDDEYRLSRDRELAIASIASCQLIAVPVPCRIIQQIDRDFAIDNAFVVQAKFGGNQTDKAYETGGISYQNARLLTHKLGRNRFEELTSYYEQAVAAASEIPGFGTVYQSEREFIPRLMAALAEGLPPGIFPGRSRNIAVELFARYQVFFRTLQCGADLPSQLALTLPGR